MRVLEHQGRLARPLALAAAMLAGVLASATACGPLRAGAGGERAMVVFTNESTSEATLYASLSGTSGYRMGTVHAGRTDTLAVPTFVTGRGNVVFHVELLASSARPSSGSVPVSEGDWLQVRLPSSLMTLVVLPAR